MSKEGEVPSSSADCLHPLDRFKCLLVVMASRGGGQRGLGGATRRLPSSSQLPQSEENNARASTEPLHSTMENNGEAVETDTMETTSPARNSTPPTTEGGPPKDGTRIELTPDMFSESGIVRSVVKCYRCHYTEAYTCWSNTPQHVRDLWFANFKHRYTWKPEYDFEIRTAFNATVQRRMKDNISKASKKREPDVWLSPDVHKSLRENRADPKFKQRSERAKRNRLSNSIADDGKFDPGHCQGSISTPALADRMAKENNGKRPSALDVWLRGHSVEGEGGERKIVRKKSIATKARLDMIQEQANEAGIQKDPDEQFFEAAGGWKRGVVPGLGSGSTYFYKKPASRSTQSPSTYRPSEIASLNERMNETERLMREQREQYEAQIAESRAQYEAQRKINEALAKQIEAMSQIAPSQPQQHPNSDGGAGTLATL